MNKIQVALQACAIPQSGLWKSGIGACTWFARKVLVMTAIVSTLVVASSLDANAQEKPNSLVTLTVSFDTSTANYWNAGTVNKPKWFFQGTCLYTFRTVGRGTKCVVEVPGGFNQEIFNRVRNGGSIQFQAKVVGHNPRERWFRGILRRYQ
jgi:hypothetical protein